MTHEELRDVLHTAGERYPTGSPPLPDLIDAGRRAKKRRRAGQIAGTVTAVALIAAGGFALRPGLGSSALPAVSSTDSHSTVDDSVLDKGHVPTTWELLGRWRPVGDLAADLGSGLPEWSRTLTFGLTDSGLSWTSGEDCNATDGWVRRDSGGGFSSFLSDTTLVKCPGPLLRDRVSIPGVVEDGTQVRLINAELQLFDDSDSLLASFSQVGRHRLATSNYPTNSRGQTYGAEGLTTSPDLVAVMGDSGVEGFVYEKELMGPEPSSPQQALAWQRQQLRNGPPVLKVYDVDGVTVVDTFTLTLGTVSEVVR